MSDNIYTVKEIATQLRVSVATIKRLCAAGEFPGAFKTDKGRNSHWRIPHSGLVSYLEKMKK